MECGLFKPEHGESQMWGQRNSKFVAAMGIQLHSLETQVRDVSCQQNHPVDHLNECIDFIGEAGDRVGSVVDELNNHINLQDVQIKQLATMVNDLIRKVEGQAKEIKNLKANQESHCKVINTMTAKVIALEQCVEDVQKKAFPKVRGEWSFWDN
jgi:hypothetical protein